MVMLVASSECHKQSRTANLKAYSHVLVCIHEPWFCNVLCKSSKVSLFNVRFLTPCIAVHWLTFIAVKSLKQKLDVLRGQFVHLGEHA